MGGIVFLKDLLDWAAGTSSKGVDMRKLCLGFSLAAMALFVACGDSSGTNANNENTSNDLSGKSSNSASELDDEYDGDVEEFGDLPKCNERKDGMVYYVEDEDVTYTCRYDEDEETGEWVKKKKRTRDDDDQESSSSVEMADVSSSSGESEESDVSSSSVNYVWPEFSSSSSSEIFDGPVISSSSVSLEPFRMEIGNNIPNNTATDVYDFDSYNYYGAELTGTDHFTYGRFEARMKMVSISGSVSSMFLYFDSSYLLGGAPWNEIDIEVLGTNPGSWQSNLITREPDQTQGRNNPKITSEFKTGFGFNSTEDFHLFALIWTPEYISWEIDSVEVRRDVIGMDKGQVEFMTEQQSLRFNLWASESPEWTGKFTGAELANGPVAQEIDYVRVYSYDQSSRAFTMLWQDDFNGSSLSSHWSKGSWEMEYVTLSANNVVVENGVCKLLMTRVHK